MRLNRYVIATTVATLLAAASPVFAAGTTDAAAQPAAAQPAPAAPAAAQTVPAAQAAPAAPVAAAAAPAAPKVPDAVKAWAKFCDPQANGHTVCIVRKLAFRDTSIVGSFVLRIDTSKGVPVLAVAAVPVGMVLKPGLRWQVDKQKAAVLPFWRCTPQTCESEQIVKPAFLSQLRNGHNLTLTAKDVDNKDFVVTIPLSGFGTSYDMKKAPTFAEYSQALGQAETAPSAGQ